MTIKPVVGDLLSVKELCAAPIGVKTEFTRGGFLVTEVPAEAIPSARDQFAMELGNKWMSGAWDDRVVDNYPFLYRWHRLADWITENFERKNSAPSVHFEPSTVTDADGDTWRRCDDGRYTCGVSTSSGDRSLAEVQQRYGLSTDTPPCEMTTSQGAKWVRGGDGMYTTSAPFEGDLRLTFSGLCNSYTIISRSW